MSTRGMLKVLACVSSMVSASLRRRLSRRSRPDHSSPVGHGSAPWRSVRARSSLWRARYAHVKQQAGVHPAAMTVKVGQTTASPGGGGGGGWLSGAGWPTDHVAATGARVAEEPRWEDDAGLWQLGSCRSYPPFATVALIPPARALLHLHGDWHVFFSKLLACFSCFERAEMRDVTPAEFFNSTQRTFFD